MIHITDPSIVRRFMDVEGEAFLDEDTGREEQNSPYCLGTVQRTWKNDLPIELDRRSQNPEFYSATNPEWTLNTVMSGKGIIYGCGGWNRYYVLVSGEVVFSEHHADAQSLNRAKIAGFRIWK